jgi:carboxyl-terminal processing protease
LPSDLVEAYEEFTRSRPPFGLVLASRLSSAAVRHIVPGSPAAMAGLEDWEVIEQVDGVNTRGQPLWRLRLDLQEREINGQSVTVTLMDRGVEERREVVLVPTEWDLSPALAEERDGALVVRIDNLPDGASEEIAKLIDPDRSLVLDLRELVWGVEDEAIAVADLFVDGGVLGGWRGRRAGSQVFEATTGTVVSEPPVVMIGPNTEGVGEILAAALQRSEATVIGHRSVGHAPHMRVVNDGDLALWLPVGQWLRPDDDPIKGNGIEPDEVVELTEGEDEDTDPTLDRALEIVGAVSLEEAA